MTTRPLLFGYVRLPMPDEIGRVPMVRQLMTTYAEAEGFTFVELLVEDEHGGTSAFAGLLDLLKRHPSSSVVVLSTEHFAKLTALQEAMCDLIERETGARVLVLGSADKAQETTS